MLHLNKFFLLFLRKHYLTIYFIMSMERKIKKDFFGENEEQKMKFEKILTTKIKLHQRWNSLKSFPKKKL